MLSVTTYCLTGVSLTLDVGCLLTAAATDLGRRVSPLIRLPGRFIPKYFILFIAMVNGIVSLISLSVFSLLVYRNARDFCVLILYPATLLYSLISSSNL